jgi:hypothetical protein
MLCDDGAQPQLEPGGVDPNGYAVFGWDNLNAFIIAAQQLVSNQPRRERALLLRPRDGRQRRVSHVRADQPLDLP